MPQSTPTQAGSTSEVNTHPTDPRKWSMPRMSSITACIDALRLREVKFNSYTLLSCSVQDVACFLGLGYGFLSFEFQAQGNTFKLSVAMCG
jgi:hypothetical protein